MTFVTPVILETHGLTLVPLAPDHEAGLRAAAADGELWNLRITSVPRPEETAQYIETALAMRKDGNRFAFAVTDTATGTVLGSSSYHDIHVVGWRTDNFNFASQAAIERLGARKDGVIRGHALRRDGTIRDTVMYSLRSGEWPEVKAQLLYQLDKSRV